MECAAIMVKPRSVGDGCRLDEEEDEVDDTVMVLVMVVKLEEQLSLAGASARMEGRKKSLRSVDVTERTRVFMVKINGKLSAGKALWRRLDSESVSSRPSSGKIVQEALDRRNGRTEKRRWSRLYTHQGTQLGKSVDIRSLRRCPSAVPYKAHAVR